MTKTTDADDLLSLADQDLSPAGDALVVADILIAARKAIPGARKALHVRALHAAGGNHALHRLIRDVFTEYE